MDLSAELAELVRQVQEYHAAKQHAQETLDYGPLLQWMDLEPRLLKYIARTGDEGACHLFIEAFRDIDFIPDFLRSLRSETATYLEMRHDTFAWSEDYTASDRKAALAYQADAIHTNAYELCKHLDKFIALHDAEGIPAPVQHKAESLMQYLDTRLKLGSPGSTERRFIFKLLKEAETQSARHAPGTARSPDAPLPGERKLAHELVKTLVQQTGLSLEAGPGFGM